MDRFYDNPPRYEMVNKKLAEFKRKNKNVKLYTIGESVLGRKIYGASIGCMQEATLFVGAVHAQEWLTTSVIMKFFEDLITKEEMSNVKVEDVLSRRGLIIVPMANPDGVEIALGGTISAKHLKGTVDKIMKTSNKSWQANARGVDLNHNFDAGFEILQQMEREKNITKPSPRQYGGKVANSEPETRALIGVCGKFDVKKVFAFHSQGEEIFYDYGENTPPNARLLAEALSASSDYKVSKPGGLASHGGFKDWFIEKTKRPGFTIEIGKGENPLPIEDLNPIYEKIQEMMLVGVLI